MKGLRVISVGSVFCRIARSRFLSVARHFCSNFYTPHQNTTQMFRKRTVRVKHIENSIVTVGSKHKLIEMAKKKR